MSTQLINFIERLGLQESKSVFVKSNKYKNSPEFASEIKFKLELIKPDAYYTFNKQPFILFFDLTSIDAFREAEIHKQVWSFDYAPLVFIIYANRVEIYNAFHYEKEVGKLKKIDMSQQEAENIFSFWELESGNSWRWLKENVYKKKYRDAINKKRVNQRLFDNIKEVRQSLEQSGLETIDSNIIILRLIFIRYLIDRGVEIPKSFIPGDSVEDRRKSFSELIEKPRDLNTFFKYLNGRFHGVLFSKRSSLTIGLNESKFLSDIFDSRKNKGENVLFDKFYFDIFDFSIIPVEVISGIYESIIDPETKDNDSAIFTPPFLVEYVLSQTIDIAIQKLPKTQKKIEFKVLDPACGSGIFLVQAYRRMVDEEFKRNNETPLGSKRLREIAERNLFGIDVNKQSLLVASFSIYIALLDYKDPKSINKFRFPKLIGKNLFAANFFNINHAFNKQFKNIEQFDFILGNPPWRSKKDDLFHIDYLDHLSKHGFKTGRFEIAQTFLLRTKDFTTTHTKCALIVTSTIFYNILPTTKDFKRSFLNTFRLTSVFDLSAARKIVFEAAISPAAIVFYEKASQKEIEKNIVQHYSLKSNIFLKYFKTIIIEKYDRKSISQQYLLNYDWMFKVALYGNVIDFQLLKRMKSLDTTIADIIDEKTVFKGDGILRGTPKDYYNFLIGKPLVKLKEITQYYTFIPEDAPLLKKEDVFLESGRRNELFEGNHILIRSKTKDESELLISYCDRPAVYEHNTYGISSTLAEKQLKLLYGYLISELYTYYQFLQSSAWGIGTRPEVKLEEYFSFPYIELTNEDQKAIIKNVDEFLSPIISYRSQQIRSENIPIQADKLKEINRIINKAYNITDIEKDLIDFVLKISRYQFQGGKQSKFSRKVSANEDTLKEYAEVFVSELSEIYQNENIQAEAYLLDHFVAINFKFLLSKKPANKFCFADHENDKEKVLRALSSSLTIWNIANSTENSENIFIQKDIKGFEKDSFYIIKPNEYKCWHRAIAWYDWAEVKEKIEQAEMETLILT